MDPIAPTPTLPTRRPARADAVPLGSDAVAFLVVAPLLGSVLASLGFWILLLLWAPPMALMATGSIGGPAAFASLAVARFLRWRRIVTAMTVALIGAAAMAVHAGLLFHVMSPHGLDRGNSILVGIWALVAFPCAAAAYGIARSIRRPGRLAAILLGSLALWCLVWTGALYLRN